MKLLFTAIFTVLLLGLHAQENTALLCADGIDNDDNGLIDCNDPACQSLGSPSGCTECSDAISFADVVLDYTPNCSCNNCGNTFEMLGVTDNMSVALGGGGFVELGFTNNFLVNSGDSSPDLIVFERGSAEAADVALRPANAATIASLQSNGILDADGDGYYEIGTAAGGGASELDIDAVVAGLQSGALVFDAVKLTDVGSGGCSGDSPGSDIDAVCAVSFTLAEICGNGIDDNNDGNIDEDCETNARLKVEGNIALMDSVGNIQFRGTNSTAAIIDWDGSLLDIKNNKLGGDIALNATDDLLFSSGGLGDTSMIIDEMGRVGIGTASPSQVLDVNGDIALSDGSGRIEFKDGNDVDAFIEISGNFNPRLHIVADDMSFKTGTSSAQAMEINDVGNIGMGNTVSGDAIQLIVATEDDPFSIVGSNIRNSSLSSSIGIQGSSQGDGSAARYGIYGDAIETDPNNTNLYGVYGEASIGAGRWAGFFEGSLGYTGSLTAVSDERLKKNAVNIGNMLEKVMQLKPRKYEFKTKEYDYINLAQGKQLGFLAQEVENIFPELVEEAPHTFLIHDEKGGKDNLLPEEKKINIKSLSYIGFIPVLTAAVQEQQSQIEAKDKRIEKLEQEMTELKDMMQQLLNRDRVQLNPNTENTSEDVPLLQQNTPNPFDGITTINYYVPEEVTQAFIQITDANGKVLERFEVRENGQGTLEVDATRMQTGQYFYSLILDGKVFESKQMLLTK